MSDFEREEREQEREMKTRAANIIDKIMIEVYGAIECEAAEEVHRILNEILMGKDTQLAMLAESDALAAHVERLTGLLREHHEDFMSDGSTDWEEEDWDGRVVHALEDTPATSLARIKADAWREAGDEVMALSAPKCARTFQLGAARHIKYKAEKRRQAEGGE